MERIGIIVKLNDLIYDQFLLDDENFLRNDDEVVDEVPKAGNYLFFNHLLYL